MNFFSFDDTICPVLFYRFSIEVMNYKVKPIFMTAASIRKLPEKAGVRFLEDGS